MNSAKLKDFGILVFSYILSFCLTIFFLTQKGMHSNFFNNLISILMLFTLYCEIFICFSLLIDFLSCSNWKRENMCFNFQKSFLRFPVSRTELHSISRADAGTSQLAGICAFVQRFQQVIVNISKG